MEEEKILDCLYDKTVTCPVCDNIFKNKSVKMGRAHLVSTGVDLKPQYTPVDVIRYSVISCPLCGYTALENSFDKIGVKQSVEMRLTLAQKFVSRKFPNIYDINTAIIRYKMALICADIKKSKKSEFGYIALRISWLYEDKGDKGNEMKYKKYAYEKYKEAYSSENFPLYGADEDTATYMIAALAYKLGEYEEALRWVGNVIISRSVTPRLKEKATDLKEKIREAKEQ